MHPTVLSSKPSSTAMEDSSEGTEWLIVAHNDARLVRSLASSVSNVSVFILESPQGTWDFGEGELFEANSAQPVTSLALFEVAFLS